MKQIEFPLNESVKGNNIQKILYFPDLKKVLIWRDNRPIEVDVNLKSMTKTEENYCMVMNELVDSKTNQNVLLIISNGLAPYMYESAKNGNGYGYGDGEGEARITATITTTTTMEEAIPTSKKVDPVPGPIIDKEPLNEIPGKDYAEFVINMARRTVKQENSLVRQIFYTALSKDTAEPLNLGIHAPTSEGKTWPTIETLKFFPEEDVQYIGKMSTMTLVRQRGILVDSKGRPVANKVRQLRGQIRKLKTKTKINEVVTDMSQQNHTPQPESPLVNVADNRLRINEIQNKRFRFLLKLYQERDRTNLKKNNAFEVGSDLGYTEETINEILRYLRDKGYIEYTMIGPYVQITTGGIDYIEHLIPNSDDVIKFRSNRMLFLKELYTIRGQRWGANMNELGKKLGFPEEKDIDDVVSYLEAHSLLKYTTLGPFVGITTYGIDFVEQYSQ